MAEAERQFLDILSVIVAGIKSAIRLEMLKSQRSICWPKSAARGSRMRTRKPRILAVNSCRRA